jgi:hypothetical protein
MFIGKWRLIRPQTKRCEALSVKGKVIEPDACQEFAKVFGDLTVSWST